MFYFFFSKIYCSFVCCCRQHRKNRRHCLIMFDLRKPFFNYHMCHMCPACELNSSAASHKCSDISVKLKKKSQQNKLLQTKGKHKINNQFHFKWIFMFVFWIFQMRLLFQCCSTPKRVRVIKIYAFCMEMEMKERKGFPLEAFHEG